MITAITTLYTQGQQFDSSIYQGSMYMGVAYTKPLTFDSSYTMPTEFTSAISGTTVPSHTIPYNLFMGEAEGFWIYKLYNNGHLVKTVQMVNQKFAIPMHYDKIETVAMPFTGSEGGIDCYSQHDGDCPSPGTAAILVMSAAFTRFRQRKN